jgi:anti-sigma regulatory factor (Ser/Thr protein kinase)
MATVEVSFTPLPAHVRTARLVATAVARRSGVDEALLDEVRLAVGEACSRAVEAHRLRCPAEPVRIALTDAAGRFEVEVTDTCSDGGGAGGRGGNGGQPGGTAATGQPGDAAQPGDSAQPGDAAQPGDSAQPGDAAQPGDSADLDLDRGLGLAVIAGLADDVRISETPGGISITMSWPAHCA